MVTASEGSDEAADFSIVVHGGAGDIPEEKRAPHADGCAEAARAGAEVLAAGGSALDAAQCAVRVLEDDPRFNAGTGACLTESGALELDASIMNGADLAAGAVCALPPFKNPIAIARAVLDDGRHVLYASEGAARFAEEHGFARATLESMVTPAVRERWTRGRGGKAEGYAGSTVGAVARDKSGHVAAATSTGGTFFKRDGRVGDTPLLGAGTYADDAAGAASATGMGEAIMRVCMTKSAVESLRAGRSPADAARAAADLLAGRGRGSGGIILVDARGRWGLARTTATMSWAAMTSALGDPARGH
ncbi:MAG TPA: isoaspartyl peptidase/L-asparaginase [Polyangiaceae bacterium]|jgi:beta-aspartyl-peptidase (threonine type)